MPLGGNWPGSNRTRIPVVTPSMQAPEQGLALPREQTRSLGQDFTDPKIGIPAALLPPETGYSMVLSVDRRGIDMDAGAHGRGHGDALDVGALGASRLRLLDGIGERLDVLQQRFVRERGLADAGV